MKARTLTASGVTADASKISGAEFFARVFGGPSREERYAERCEHCIRAIVRGDTYGFPPVMVADCRKIMAEREALGEQVEREIAFTMELQQGGGAMPPARAFAASRSHRVSPSRPSGLPSLSQGGRR